MKKVLSIDPGINNTGISVIEKTSNSYMVLDVVLVKNNRKFTEEEKVIEDKFGSRTVKVLSILSNVECLLNKHSDVEAIVIEAPFYNTMSPMAYGSILEVIFAIKYRINFERKLPLYLVEPLLIKKIFANNRLATKEGMKQYLESRINNKEIVINSNIEELSEHEIDSIAIGYIFFVLGFSSTGENQC